MCILMFVRGLFTFNALEVVLPIVISFIALFVALRDRRPLLILRARKGDWCTLKPTTDQKSVMFRGVVEIYNVSARANAIRDYEFWCKRKDANWEHMESEVYHESVNDEVYAKNNETPLTLAPYSGIEANVLAFTKMPQPYEMLIRIEVEDLFGKRYRVQVKATS